MPIYGSNKTRTMVRSVLPSSGRKMAKLGKDKLHRYNRRIVDTDIRNLRGYADEVIDIYDDVEKDLEYYHEAHRTAMGGWDDIVYERRQSDKLAHFEKWAYVKTQHLRPEDRFKAIAAKLDGALGTHALTHLEFLKHDPVKPAEDSYHQGLPRQLRTRRYGGARHNIRKEITDALLGIYRDDRKRKEFNAYLLKYAGHDKISVRKRNFDVQKHTVSQQIYYSRGFYYPLPEEENVPYAVRTLNGYHDLTKFVRDIFAATKTNSPLGYHPSWLKYTKEYFNIE
jgi:hypothetical protein